MDVSYKRLWKLLIDRDMKKGELCKLAGISNASITKMEKTVVLQRMCSIRYVLR